MSALSKNNSENSKQFQIENTFGGQNLLYLIQIPLDAPLCTVRLIKFYASGYIKNQYTLRALRTNDDIQGLFAQRTVKTCITNPKIALRTNYEFRITNITTNLTQLIA